MTDFPVVHVLEYPYSRTLGPVLGPFFTGLRDGHILGIRCGKRVICPPMEFDPDTGVTLEPDLVEVGPAGTVQSWTWIAEPTPKHPFQEPFAFALVKLDGADTAMVHAVKAAGPQAMSTGMRVKAQFHEKREGAITDVHFVPEAEARAVAIEPGEKPLKSQTHLISLTYRAKLMPHRARFAAGLLQGKFIGQRSPASGKVYIPGKGYDPIARVRIPESEDVELSPVGTVISYTIASGFEAGGDAAPISATILLDGAGQSLPFQQIRTIPIEEFRVGMRLRAVFRPPGERNVDAIDNNWMYVGTGDAIERWEPTGEPDVPFEQLRGVM